MTQETVKGLIVLRAAKGKVISNGDSYGEEVWLSPIDKAENWIETDPPKEMNDLEIRAELYRYKLAVAEVVKINTATALKGDLVSAITNLKAAVELKEIAERTAV